MRVKEYRALSNQDLVKQLEESNQALFNLKIRLSTRQLVNNREIVTVRKNIARIRTILRERELGAR